jgi:hypothetical protein
MRSFTLPELLKSAGARLASDLADQLVPHAGEQGAVREVVVRTFLRSVLPRHLDVSGGFVFDCHGNVSRQVDIIIADTTVGPRFEVSGATRFYPCESVVAAGEVKSHSDSASKTWDALSNLKSVTELDRSAGGTAVAERTGAPLDHRSSHLDRIFTFLLTIDRPLAGDRAREVVAEYVTRSSPHVWPNVVFALNKYLITYCCDDGYCPNPHHARGISLLQAEPSRLLLQFYVFLSQALVVTNVARMSSQAHLSRGLNISADVVGPTLGSDGEPPPYLSQLLTVPWNDHPYNDTADD